MGGASLMDTSSLSDEGTVPSCLGGEWLKLASPTAVAAVELEFATVVSTAKGMSEDTAPNCKTTGELLGSVAEED